MDVSKIVRFKAELPRRFLLFCGVVPCFLLKKAGALPCKDRPAAQYGSARKKRAKSRAQVGQQPARGTRIFSDQKSPVRI
jgi:hypothetical protein